MFNWIYVSSNLANGFGLNKQKNTLKKANHTYYKKGLKLLYQANVVTRD